jgi:hypothetical protein
MPSFKHSQLGVDVDNKGEGQDNGKGGGEGQ